MLKPGLKRHQNNHPSKPDVVFVNFYCICIQMLFICFAFVCRIAQCHLYEMKSAQIHVFIAHILRIGFPMFFFGFWPRPKIFGFSHLQVRKGSSGTRKIAILLQFRATNTHDLTKGFIGHPQDRNFTTVSGDRHARSYERVANPQAFSGPWRPPPLIT